MTMIKEAYCSNEVCKLLKGKGFNEPITELNRLVFKDGERPVLKVTHQKAMAWLREKCVYLEPYCSFNKGKDSVVYSCAVFQPSLCVGKMDCRYETNYFSQYEEAVEAALKYALENLI